LILFPYKYKVSGNAPSYNQEITEYNVMLRLAEQYLIRSEAEAENNDLTDGANDLNVIRNRAGLNDISISNASTQAGLLAAILHERQVELFAEWGSRWFDLIRTDNVNSVMGAPGNVCTYKHGTWNAYDALFPIPQTERNNDPNLTQNTGY
jgi:starch-binding outer membrane protein, SusD/RagB family